MRQLEFRMKSPLSLVKERFGDKEKLVAAVTALSKSDLWIDRLNESKGLDHVSNLKLLKLHETLTQATKTFGSRAKLIDAILDLEGRKKDAGLRARLEGHPLPRLLDAHKAAARRAKTAKAAAPKAEKAKAPKLVRSKKAQAKAKAAKAPAKKAK
jgi:hypothetical protein